MMEILVSVAVILILMALLLSSVKTARDSAMNATCMARMKQVGDLFNAYLADNNGIAPQRWNSVTRIGYETQLLHGKGETNKQGRELFFCQAHPKLDKVRQLSYGMNWYYDNASLLVVPQKTKTILVAEVDGIGGRGSRKADRANVGDGTIAKERHFKKSNYLFFDGHIEALVFSNTLSPFDMWGEDQGMH